MTGSCERSLTPFDWASTRLDRPVRRTETVRQSELSRVDRLDTDSGSYYLKRVGCAFAHEPALTEALAAWGSGATPRVRGHDVRRGWLLLADEGPSLEDQGRCLAESLAAYGAFQVRVSPHRDAMRLMGVPDRRLEVLPGLYRCLLEEDLGLRPGELALAHDLFPSVVRHCHELAAYGIEETLHHDRLDPAHVLGGEARFVFAGWGECAVGHPFLTAMRISELGVEARDAYLSAFGEDEDLKAAFALARPLGPLCRALTWQRIWGAKDDPSATRERDEAARWFRRFLRGLTTNATEIASERL